MTTLTEPIVEEATLAWFTELGYTHLVEGIVIDYLRPDGTASSRRPE